MPPSPPPPASGRAGISGGRRRPPLWRAAAASTTTLLLAAVAACLSLSVAQAQGATYGSNVFNARIGGGRAFDQTKSVTNDAFGATYILGKFRLWGGEWERRGWVGWLIDRATTTIHTRTHIP